MLLRPQAWQEQAIAVVQTHQVFAAVVVASAFAVVRSQAGVIEFLLSSALAVVVIAFLLSSALATIVLSQNPNLSQAAVSAVALSRAQLAQARR